ncbi:MAG: L-aspartate oxidase [Bacillota bacterium]|jgi:L-aspartate oxidase|nr:L-aspartate oxidase [Bacillota bacterium]HPZ22925.1 L-aspartate oxidase [Bacillota bacterium]
MLSASTEKIEVWDVVIIGGGVAGLYTALLAAESGKNILLLAKTELDESNTQEAQGGIAASVSEQDTPRLHLLDTFSAGAGLCDYEAVRTLVEEGPAGINDLIQMGVNFDQNEYGLALTKEGAHSLRRILHARGDATGKVIREALTARLRFYANITVRTHTFALDLIMTESGCAGLYCLDPTGQLVTIYAANTVIASGGACNLFAITTNPPVATGDGIAMAWRAGVPVGDMEFVQFHPTALMLEGAPHFLISEAVRGEGALLLNDNGERFMPRYHAQGELAPRDAVCRAMLAEMEKTGARNLWLDVSPLKGEDFPNRFPTIYRKCTEYGLDLPGDLIPVAPAAHYFIGGIITDINGWTGVPALFACGEASCTGVHGANRLASNSLLEALVFGRRIAQAIIKSDNKPLHADCPLPELLPANTDAPAIIDELGKTMWQYVGLRRDETGLKKAQEILDTLTDKAGMGTYGDRSSMELVNMLTLAKLVTEGALLRKESRGGHYRLDYPRSQRNQLGRWVFQRGQQTKFKAIQEGRL